jgi:hypothetical protein
LTLTIGKLLRNMLGCIFVAPIGLGCGVVVIEDLGFRGVPFNGFMLVEDSLSLRNFYILSILEFALSYIFMLISSIISIFNLSIPCLISFLILVVISCLRLFVNSCFRSSYFCLISSLSASSFYAFFLQISNDFVCSLFLVSLSWS